MFRWSYETTSFTLPKMSGYVKNFKEKNNKLIFLHIDDEKLLEKYKTIWTKIEELKKHWIGCFTCLWSYIYIKPKKKACSDIVYTNFGGLNVLEDSVKYESFTIIYIDPLLVYQNKYLDDCAHKIVNTQMVDYFGDNLFESDENLSLIWYMDLLDVELQDNWFEWRNWSDWK